MKTAQIWKLQNAISPIVKIEYTLYIKSSNGKLVEMDAVGIWSGTRAPKGAKMLATVKVKENSKKCANHAFDSFKLNSG